MSTGTPVFISGAAGCYASSAYGTVAMPSGLVSGSTLVMVIRAPAVQPLTPAGWTLLVYGAGSISIMTKVVGAYEPAAYIVPFNYGPGAYSVAVSQWTSGSVVPVITYGLYEGGVATNVLSPSLSPPIAGCLRCDTYFQDAANTLTLPAGQTNPGFAYSGASQCLNSGYETLAASGATGTRTATSSGSANALAAGFILRPTYAPVGIGFGGVSHPGPDAGWTASGAGGFRIAGKGWHGNFKVTGTVYDGASPASKRVFITPRKAQAVVLAEQYSDPITGAYAFYNLAPGMYDVWGLDQFDVENDAFLSRVVALPM